MSFSGVLPLFVGLPASVVRASTLFSFLTVGRFIHHGKNTFHFTVVSFLVLLLAHPPFLKQIGFQFSFLAVFGILWIHPFLQRLWNPKIGWIKKYWQWTTVSLAAQIAVGPLSVYYFHQFPSLFLIQQSFDRTFFWFISVFGSWGFHLAYGGFTPSFSSWNIHQIVVSSSFKWVGFVDCSERSVSFGSALPFYSRVARTVHIPFFSRPYTRKKTLFL